MRRHDRPAWRAGARPLEAVLFDLDGVLIDSEALMRHAFDACYRQAGLPGEPPIEAYLEHMGDSFPRIMQRLGLPATLWEPYRALCGKRLDLVRLFPAVPGLLSRLRRRGLKLAVVTGKDRLRATETLAAFGLLDFFGAVVASDELQRPKPDPEGVRRALGQLECRAEAALMVGDAVNDVLCAQAAGVRAVAVTWGTKPERVQALCRPDHIVHDWVALEALITSRWATASGAAATAKVPA
jgi:AHBA synthesis associated protein